MSRIDKLIEQLCPNGVGFKELGEIVRSIKTGLNPRQNFTLNAGNAKNYYVTVKEITTGKIKFSNKTDRINDDAIKIISNRSELEIGDVLFSGIGTIGKIALVDIPTNNWNVSESVFLLKPIKSIVISKYLMYILTSNQIKEQYEGQSVGSTLKGVRMGKLSQLKIPLPPLVIQQEIVNILDKFTALDAELQAELEARKKQYEFYRNQLLNFEGKEVEWKSLGEIAYYPNRRIPAGGVNDTNYVGVENLLQNKQGKILSNYVPKAGNLIEYSTSDILIGNIRPYLKKIWLASNNGGTNGDVIVIRIKDIFNLRLITKFLYFVLSSDIFFDYAVQFSKGGKMPRGDKNAILKFNIPIPSLAEQERIVSTLDKFEELVNTGIPAEIGARRKQYEYYREKLLTFNKVEQLA